MSVVLDELRDPGAGRIAISVEKLCLTPHEAAAVLSVGVTTLYELLKRGEISSIAIGRARRIPLASLKAYVAAALERPGPVGVCDTSAADPASSANGWHPAALGAFSGATSGRARRRRPGR